MSLLRQPTISWFRVIGLTIGLLSPGIFAAEVDEPPLVSIVNLIATPERFHGKKIVVGGYLQFQLENQSLCLMAEPPSMQECLWVSIDDGAPKSDEEARIQRQEFAKWQSYDGRRVVIHGTFDMDSHGHFGGWSGSLRNVTKVSVAKAGKR